MSEHGEETVTGDPDAIDREAAQIDPRDPEAPEQVAELIDEADEA